MKITKDGLTFIVNNEKSGISDGTIPVRWQADNRLCQVGPTHALLFVQHESDSPSFCGQRYFVKFAAKKKFVTFRKAGAHQITFVLLSPDCEDVERLETSFLHRDSKTTFFVNYDPVDIEASLENDQVMLPKLLKDHVLTVVTAKVSVDKRVFASRPTSAFMTWFYGMVNWWWKFKPVDQCEQRKRALFSIALIWPVFACRLLMGAYCLLITLVHGLLRLGAAFFGYRPVSLFRGMGRIWTEGFGHGRFASMDKNDRRYDILKYRGEYLCRTWVFDDGTDRIVSAHCLGRAERLVRLPITPAGLVLTVVCTWLLFTEWKNIDIFLEALLAMTVSVKLWLVVMRIVWPVHKSKNEDLWEDGLEDVLFDGKVASPFMRHMYGSVAFGVVAWMLYAHTSEIVARTTVIDFIAVRNTGLWVMSVLFLLVTAVAAVRYLRRTEFSFKDWYQGFRDRAQGKKEARKARMQEQVVPELLRAETRVKAWRSGKPIPASTLPEEACVACTTPTVGDRLVLMFEETKAMVCKPYES